MRNETLSSTFEAALADAHARTGQLLQKVLFFHDVRVICQTNHPAMLALLEEMLAIFPEPEQVRGEIVYNVLCYESASQFPLPLPPARIRTETVRLLTDTRLKYYDSRDHVSAYHSYVALAPFNGNALTAMSRTTPLAVTQLEQLARFQPAFLRRYVFLLALGSMMSRFGFEPFHAAAITAPWDTQQGALIIGPSGSGKTTLSIGCAAMGCGLLGDDLVMLRERAAGEAIEAHAITHEVSVRSSSLHLWDALAFLWQYPADRRDKRYCSIEAIRGGSTRLQAPIRLLLFPTLAEEAESHIIPLSKASALQELIEQGMSKVHHQSSEAIFTLLTQLARQARGYRLTLSRTANDGPQLVQSLFAGDAYA